MLAQFLHCRIRIFRLALLWRCVALPFVETTAGRVILKFMDRLIAAHEFARHRVWMWELTFRRVINNVREGKLERLFTELYLIGLIRFFLHLIQKKRIYGSRLLP